MILWNGAVIPEANGAAKAAFLISLRITNCGSTYVHYKLATTLFQATDLLRERREGVTQSGYSADVLDRPAANVYKVHVASAVMSFPMLV